MLTSDISSTISRSSVQALTTIKKFSAPVPLPDPTTVNFTSAQVVGGFTGPVNTTKNAARVYVRAQLTLWSGWITGTEAKVSLTSEYGDFDGAVQVAIDGGAFVNASRSGQVFTLFTALPHATHFVEFRVADGLGDVAFIASSGNVLTVTGRPPALQVLTNKIQVGADSTLGLYSGATMANSAGFTPLLQAPKSEAYGSNIGSVKIRGAFTKLVVTLNGTRKVGVSKNGGVPVFHYKTDEAGLPSRALIIPCDGSISTYNVWDDGNFYSLGGVFAVATDSAFLDIGVKRRLDQYGDSVTFGSGPDATSGDVETMPLAATLGFVGSTTGRSGLTVEAAQTVLATVLPRRTIAPTDVAVIALGGNNAGNGIGDPQKAAYLADINLLLAAGYSKVLCRGILPSADPNGASFRLAANAALKSVVDAKADPRVVWVNTDTWTGWASEDNAHPTHEGYYPTLYGYALRDYPALMGL